MTNNSRTVLIVDDDKPMALLAKKYLDSSNFLTVVANSIQEAKQLLLSSPPFTLLWIDHYLQDGTGLDIIEFVRNVQKNEESLIYIVSNTTPGEPYQPLLDKKTHFFLKAEVAIKKIVEDLEKTLNESP